jgi:hypothetical protein
MIRFLHRNQQVFILFIFLYAVFAVMSIYFIQPLDHNTIKSFSPPLLSGFPHNLITSRNTYLLGCILLIPVLLIIGFYLVRLEINYLIIPNRSQFAAIFYIAITAFAYRYELFTGAVIGSLFLVFAIDRVLSTIENKKLSFRFIDAGLLLSLGSLFYFNIIFLLPFLWLSQLTLRSNYRKELLFSLIGISLPFIYIFSVYFIFNKSVSDTLSNLKNYLATKNDIDYSWHFLAGIGVYFFGMLVTSLFALQKFTITKIQVRKLFQLLFYLFLNLLAIFILVPSAGYELFFVISIPVAALFSIYFAECKSNIFNSFLFLLLISAPIVINFLI